MRFERIAGNAVFICQKLCHKLLKDQKPALIAKFTNYSELPALEINFILERTTPCFSQILKYFCLITG